MGYSSALPVNAKPAATAKTLDLARSEPADYDCRLPLTRPSGGIGRRARFRIWYRKVCRFDSCLGYQNEGHPLFAGFLSTRQCRTDWEWAAAHVQEINRVWLVAP